MSNSTATPSPATDASEEVAGLVEAANGVIAEYTERPEDAETRNELLRVRRAAAERIAQISGAQKDGAELQMAREFMRAFAESGATDYPLKAQDLALARDYRRRGWPGLLAAMLLAPAWQWPDAPRLESVPIWLWVDYAQYLFHAPQGFTAIGHAEAYAEYYLRRLDELARLTAANRGSVAVRAVLTVFMRASTCVPLYFCTASLRRIYQLRAQLLQCARVRPTIEMKPRPRQGRRLRVGFINRHFGPQTETYTTLPMFEQLDPERFEVLLFAHEQDGSPLEQYARQHAAGFTVLPDAPAAQVDLLRAAALDVAVIGTNLTAKFNVVTGLALHRFAPLQAVNNSCCTTTGLPEIDLYISGTLTEGPAAPAHFTERLGLVTGPAHAFNYEADRQEPVGTWTRAALGLPDDAIVFVTGANYFKIIPEMRHAWARLLAAVPGSRLLVHPFNPNWSSRYPVKRFAAEMDAVLAEHGIATDRFILSSVKFPSRSDVKALLGVGDIYLDTFPFGGVNSLVDPLELGMPVVAWEGDTMRSRMGAALLRQLQLPELIATDEAGYLAIATRLATDAPHRAAVRERILGSMGAAPLFLDPLAASDLTGALLETAYDELVAVGRKAFRAARTPLRAPATVSLDVPSRRRHAATLLAAGRAARASDYLVAAVGSDPNNAELWFELATALARQGQLAQALQALEGSLRIDGTRRAAWLMLAGIATRTGAESIARELVDRLAPAHLAPELAKLMTPADPDDALMDFTPAHLRLDR